MRVVMLVNVLLWPCATLVTNDASWCVGGLVAGIWLTVMELCK